MITIQLELTKEDFYQFSYFTSWSAPWNNKKRVIYYSKFILTYFFLLVLFFYVEREKLPRSSLIILSVAVVVLSLLILPAWNANRLRKQVEIFYDDPKNSNLFLKTDLIFDEKGIESRDSVSFTTYLWSAIVRKAETTEYFYLYRNSILGIVIPKTSFKSFAEIEEFRKLLLTHLSLQAEFDSLNK